MSTDASAIRDLALELVQLAASRDLDTGSTVVALGIAYVTLGHTAGVSAETLVRGVRESAERLAEKDREELH